MKIRKYTIVYHDVHSKEFILLSTKYYFESLEECKHKVAELNECFVYCVFYIKSID